MYRGPSKLGPLLALLHFVAFDERMILKADASRSRSKKRPPMCSSDWTRRVSSTLELQQRPHTHIIDPCHLVTTLGGFSDIQRSRAHRSLDSDADSPNRVTQLLTFTQGS